jgi:cob(I)alamin adenosyltransferase
MKLYTKTGDDGSTGLFGGQRVSKDHPRVEAYGTVDELNATIGLAAAACDADRPLHERFRAIFKQLQSRLFDIGADLATPDTAEKASHIVRVGADHAAEVEQWIDEIDGGNEPMRHFILPGGSELAARLHVARTVCRRAERRLVRLATHESIGDGAVVYLNRVSDLLFAMARRANLDAGVSDVEWISSRDRPEA